MKKHMLFIVSVLIAVAGSAGDTASAPLSLVQFDEDLAVCRRVVRECCAIVQKMAPLPTADKDRQAEGLKLLAAARKQWADVQSKYAANPPAEYAKDKAFKARLRDFANALDRLALAVAAGDVKQVDEILANGLALVNKPYGIAL